MFKKKFKGALLASALLVFSATTVVGLSSCNGTTDKKEDEVTAIVITNKEELTNVWEVGQDDRKISIEVTPNTLSAATLINNGKIKIESSNTEVITVVGTMLHAKAAGKSTITVSAGEIKESVEITINEKTVVPVSKLADVLKEAAAQVPTSDYKTYTEKSYRVKGVIVANDGDRNVVFYDGEAYGFVYSSTTMVKLPVGTTVYVEGGLCNNYGVLQFGSKAIIEEVTEASEKVAMPTANKFTTKDFNEYYDLATKNNSKLADVAKPTPNNYIEFTGKYDGDFGVVLDVEDKVKPKQANVSIYKASEAMKKVIKPVVSGSEIKVIGAILGYNSSTKKFNVIPEKIEVLKKVVKPTEIEIATNKTTMKVFETAELSVVNTPENAGGDVEYVAVEGADVVKISGNKVSGLKAGKAKIKATNKTFKLDSKNTIEITVEPINYVSLNSYTATGAEIATGLGLDSPYVTAMGEVNGATVRLSNGHKYSESTMIGANRDSQWGKSYVTAAQLSAIDPAIKEDGDKIGDNYYASLDVFAVITKATKVSFTIKNAKTEDSDFTAYILETKDKGKTYTKVAEKAYAATDTSALEYTPAAPTTAAYSVVIKGGQTYFAQIDKIDIQSKAKGD